MQPEGGVGTPSDTSQRDPEPTRVLLCTDGRYPHGTGDVATWCDSLVRALPEVEFLVPSLLPGQVGASHLSLPDNVLEVAPLDSTTGPAAGAPTEEEVEAGFVPLLASFLELATGSGTAPEQVAAHLVGMHEFFREADFSATWVSRAVWDTFVYGGRRRLLAVRGGGPCLAEASEAIRWLRATLEVLGREIPRADVSHAVGAGAASIAPIVARATRGTPFLLSDLGTPPDGELIGAERRTSHVAPFRRAVAEAIASAAYSLADQISPVAVRLRSSPAGLRTPRSRVRVIHPGVDLDVYRPPAQPGEPRRMVCCISPVGPGSDLETMLHVARLVIADVPDALFRHHGAVVDEDYWARLRGVRTELGVAHAVEFVGTVGDVSAIEGADLVLATSATGAFPMVVPRALACGVPVVTADVGGVAEVLEGAGIATPPRDAVAMARAVSTMLLLPAEARSRLSGMARDRAVERFDLARFASEHRQSYASLAAASSASPGYELELTLSGDAATAPAGMNGGGGASVASTEDQPAAAESLRGTFADGDPFMRAGALTRNAGGDETEEMALSALVDEYPQVRREAVRALARLGGHRASVALATRATEDPSAEVREEAVSALAALLSRGAADQRAE